MNRICASKHGILPGHEKGTESNELDMINTSISLLCKLISLLFHYPISQKYSTLFIVKVHVPIISLSLFKYHLEQLQKVNRNNNKKMYSYYS